MLDWINVLFWLFSSSCLFFLGAPLYGQVTVGYALVAIAVMGAMFNFFIRRFK